ncbi:hypothetical protein GGI12_003668 [Dipsacomyces acuminosporus]|nr:hypothetical protein GGI12_003668 [Dipsacomyces acuminosporus]
MASNVFVVYGPGRSVNIRTTPAMTLQAVLTEACSKVPNVGSPESYILLYKEKVLDLSLTMRFANLAQGSKLTLKPATASQRRTNSSTAAAATGASSGGSAKSSRNGNKVVKVALQITGSGRIIDDFQPASTLWDIVTTAEQRSNGTLNLTNKYRAVEKGEKGLVDGQKSPWEKMQSVFSVVTGIGGSSANSTSSSVQGSPSPSVASDSGSESKKNNAKPVVYQQPVLLLLNREFSSNEDLKSTSLASLGFSSGSVMIRFSFRDASTVTMGLTHQVQGVGSTTPALQASTTASNSPAQPRPSQFAQQRATSEPPISTASTKEPAAARVSCLNPEAPAAPVVQRPKELEASADSLAAFDEALISVRQVRVLDVPAQANVSLSSRFAMPDSFYELGAAELKALVAAQRTRQEAERGFRLRSEREEEERRRIAQFKLNHPKTVIRFRFPDLVQVQATFLTLDHVSELYSFIKGVLSDSSVLQALAIQPPAQDLKDSLRKTLYDAKLSPAAVVHVRLSSKMRTMGLLKKEVQALLEMPDVPTNFASDAEGNGDNAAGTSSAAGSPFPQSRDATPDVEAGIARASNSAADASASFPQDSKANSSAAKMPKWFLAGQKRR